MAFARPCVCFLVLSFLASVAANEEPKPQKAESPTVLVFPDKCRFSVPVSEIKKSWKWGVSKKDDLKYSWLATIKVDDEVYQVGYSCFNHEAIEKSGTFAELLQAGQTNVWRLEKDGGATRVKGVRVTSSADDKRLLFELNNKEWTERLFKNKPKEVKFHTRGSQQTQSETDGRVEYKP